MSFSIYAPVSDSNPLPVDMTGGGPAEIGATANSTGNSTITPAAPNEIRVVTLTGTARTSKFILAATGAAAGYWMLLRFVQPATASIVQEVRDLTAGGTTLYSYTSDGSGADHWACLVYFDGTNWQRGFNLGNVV